MIESRNLARLCALLAVAAFALLASGQSVWAHAGHGHAAAAVAAQPVEVVPISSASPTARQQASMVREGFARDAQADLATPATPEKHPSQGDCCCSGALCHGGALPQDAPLALHYLVSEAVSLSALPVIALSLAFGIERPPR